MSVTRDATSGRALPQTAAEWTALLTGSGIANPASAWLLQMPLGNATDVIGAITLTAANSPGYQTAVPGWSAKSVSWTSGSTAQFANTTTAPDPTSTSIALLVYAYVSTTPITRLWFAFISGLAIGMAAIASGQAEVNDAGQGHTTEVVADGAVRPYLLVLNNAAGTCKMYTPSEIVSTGYYAGAGSTIGTALGALASATPDGGAVYAAQWTGAAAEMDDAHAAALISLLWTPAPTLTSITVAPSSSTIAPGGNVTLTATGHYSDSSTVDVTSTATWSTDNALVATVVAGVVTGVGAGSCNITATLTAIAGSAGINVAVPVVLGLVPTFTMIAHKAPIAGVTNMLAQNSVGVKAGVSTAPPTALQTASGQGVRQFPFPTGPVAIVDYQAPQNGTLLALQSGARAFKWVLAVEACPYLFTDCADPSMAVLAHAGTDYTTAIGGLYVELDNVQSIDPHDPFANVGGTCTIKVQADADDQFGIDTHKRAGGVDAKLLGTINRVGMSAYRVGKLGYHEETFPWLSVDHGMDFVAGDAWIGTECLVLNGPAESRLSYSVRGKYSPFPSGGTGGLRFAEHHRVAADSNGVWLNPELTQIPKTWTGRLAGLWMHTVAGDGTLNSKADALCVYAGRIAETGDDAATGYTLASLNHILASIKDTTIGRDMWSATIAEGVFLKAGRTFSATDFSATHAARTANQLVVVQSGAVGPNQINEDYYSLQDVSAFLNTWLAAEFVAARLWTTFKFTSPATTSYGVRTTIDWYNANAASGLPEYCHWEINFPAEVGSMLGWDVGSDTIQAGGSKSIDDDGYTLVGHQRISDNAPYILPLVKASGTGQSYWQFLVENERGTILDQWQFLPSGQKPAQGTTSTLGLSLIDSQIQTRGTNMAWGIFLLGGQWLVIGAQDLTASSSTLTQVVPLAIALPGTSGVADLGTLVMGARADNSNAGPLTIQQLFILDSDFATLMKAFFYSTGTCGYNHPVYDVLGFGLGLGIPYGMLGPAFEASIDRLPGAQLPLCCVIDKPTKFSDLVASDLELRSAFFVWREGHIELSQWTTPTSDLATVALDETNKAEPAGNITNQRSPSLETSQWLKNVVKIEYDRDITKATDTSYAQSITLEDQRSVDDAGGVTNDGTIEACNTFSQFSSTGAGVETLTPGYLSLMPMFSRPVRLMTRSIDMRLFEGVAPGDQAIVTDNFMRDPETGRRGIQARAGIITRIHYNPGGPTAGQPGHVNDMMGDVDVAFLDDHRYASFAPAAELDETYNDLGFVKGYKASTHEIYLKSHAYSETTEASDYTRFHVGYRIVISQIDPDTLAAQSWPCLITVEPSGHVLTIDRALDGFDTSKLYRVTYDRFGQCVGLQLASTFQAATATGRIERLGYAYEWTSTPEQADPVPNGVADLAELLPDNSYGDGRPLDVGNERGLIRAMNAMVDYKAARCAPSFFFSGLHTHVNVGFEVHQISHIFLGLEQLSNSVHRYLYVAPWMQCRFGAGSGALVRVTLSRSFPMIGTGIGGHSGSLGIQFNDQYDQQTWDCSSDSTAYVLGQKQPLSCNVKDAYGYAYLVIEKIGTADCMGLGICQEGPRLTT